jgi:predicted metal-binding membrane protein
MRRGARDGLLAPSRTRVTAALLGVAVLAWILTVRLATGGMSASAGRSMPLPAFLGAWVAMMAAMMLPSVAPAARLWLRAIGTQGPSGVWQAARIAGFVSGYLVSWAGFGLVAFLAIAGGASVSESAPGAARWIGAAILLAAGLYQLTPLKQACLARCRAPFGLFLTYSAFGPRARDLRVGMHHGAYCVACCWGLMIVLVALGMSNLVAMAALAAAVAVEKSWRRGPGFARVLGLAFVALAVVAPFVSSVAPGLAPATPMRM